MKISIKNRLILLQILPVQGSLSDMVEIMDLAKKLKISDEEKKIISYKEDNTGSVTWDSTKDPNIDIQLNSDIIRILKNTISKLDEEGKISISMVDLAISIDKL